MHQSFLCGICLAACKQARYLTGMMGVIVKQLYAILFAKELEPARYQPVFGQCIGNAIVWYAQLARDRDGGQCILYVMPARHAQLVIFCTGFP